MKIMPDSTFLRHPLTRRIGWVGYAILFYLCGESFVVWLLEPAQFAGGLRWLGVILFPPVLIGFFFVQRRLGCGANCRLPDGNEHPPSDTKQHHYTSPPGI
jgi:hypothetical protein